MADVLKHDTTLDFDPTPLDDAIVQRQVWRYWEEPEGDFYAGGSCPRCHAPGQEGHTRRISVLHGVEAGEAAVHRPVAPERIDVAFTCGCGSAHGRTGASGCGARWYVAWGPT